MLFVGCFRDSWDDRDMGGMKIEFPERNSPEYCVEWCYRGGFNYAGLQYGYECWCGDTYGKHGAVGPGECSMACPGSSTSICGGNLVQSIYKTGYGRTGSNLVHLSAFKDTSPSVRVAFILTLNGRADRQVKRMLSLIYRRQHFYLLHVDSRQDFLRREMEKFLGERPSLKRNVRLVDYGIAPIWGGTSLLTVVLRGIRELLDWSSEWDFVLNLSETDLPVKKVEYLSAFLAEYKGKNFVGSAAKGRVYMAALEHTFLECEQRMWLIGPRALPVGIRIDAGSEWFILDRKFANYSVLSKDDLVLGLKRVFQYTVLPGEAFFQTLLHNSPFCATLVADDLKLISWNRKERCKCQHDHVVDWCGCSPRAFRAADVDELVSVEKKPVFFARKFEAILSNPIVEQVVDKLLNARVLAGGYYWYNEYDWLDRRPPDDATLALYESWTRLAPRWFELLAQCLRGKLSLKRVEQVRYIDALKGITTTFELDTTGVDGVNSLRSHIVQMKWTPRPFKHITSSKASALLMTLDVGSNYYVKDETLRDVATAFSPNSVLTAVVHLRPVLVISELTFVWLDPEGSLAHLKEVHLSDVNTQRTVNTELTLLDPLLAGSWTLQLYLNRELIGERVFVVLPIGPLATSPPRYTATVLDWLVPMLKPLHHDDSPSNAIEWTDRLVQSLWTVEDICAIDPTDEWTGNDCADTEWSAISSDPHRWFDEALADQAET